jgi:hypothetical protein
MDGPRSEFRPPRWEDVTNCLICGTANICSYRGMEGFAEPKQLRQINPLPIVKPYIPKIHFNIILSTAVRFPKRYHPFRFRYWNAAWTSHHSRAHFMPRAHHPLSFANPNNIWWRLSYKLSSSSLFNFSLLPIPSSVLDPNIHLSTLLKITRSLCSSTKISGHVSQPYETDKIIVLCIITFTFLDYRREQGTNLNSIATRISRISCSSQLR